MMRPFWYSCSCDQAMGMAASAAPSASANFHSRTPARNSTMDPPAASSSAVPRSGCFSTSRVGMPIRASGGNR